MQPSTFSVQIAPAFAVPMALARHPAPAELNQRLRALFLQRAAEGERHRNPAPSMKTTRDVFESEFRLFESADADILALRDFCWRALLKVVAELNGYPPDLMRRLRIFASAWFHVTRQGGYFGVHNHPMASWSGVYCVDPGDGGDPAGETGRLSFVNPQASSQMFVDTSLAQLREPFNIGSRDFRLQAGDLVIFPSWLLHQVTDHRGPAERITVAFNAWFRLDPADAAATPGA
jgi:uncharacterized protein (TIGR02466 family)